MFNVKDFGVTGNGTTDDTAALQILIDFANGLGGGVLYFPAGTYKLTIGASGYALRLRPRVSFSGENRALSVLKLADGQGDYKALLYNDFTDVSADDISILSVTLDQNKTNNPVTYADGAAWIAAIKPRMALWCHKVKRMTVRDCRFTNLDAINTINLNGNGLGAGAVQDARIIDCLFDGVGASPIEHDYSAIYLHGDDCRIHNNTFRAAAPGNKTAIETHGTGHLIDGNIARDFVNGVLVTSPQTITVNNLLKVTNDIKYVVVDLPVTSVISANNLRV